MCEHGMFYWCIKCDEDDRIAELINTWEIRRAGYEAEAYYDYLADAGIIDADSVDLEPMEVA